MALKACDCNVIYTLLLLHTGQTLEQTDKLQKLLSNAQLHSIFVVCQKMSLSEDSGIGIMTCISEFGVRLFCVKVL